MMFFIGMALVSSKKRGHLKEYVLPGNDVVDSVVNLCATYAS